MPAAPRPHGKARKIWLKVMGNPLFEKKTDHDKKVDKELLSQDIMRNRKP